MRHQVMKIKFVSRVIDINHNSEMKQKKNILIETNVHKYIEDINKCRTNIQGV